MRLAYPERIFGMAYCAASHRIAVRSFSHIDILDADTLSAVTRLPAGHGMPMVAFSPSGLLASGDREGITVYDPELKSLARLACPEAVVITTAFTPDSEHVAAGCFDGAVRFWELP
jgi:WD40 repeat protein